MAPVYKIAVIQLHPKVRSYVLFDFVFGVLCHCHSLVLYDCARVSDLM